jgi:hypothetical protein
MMHKRGNALKGNFKTLKTHENSQMLVVKQMGACILMQPLLQAVCSRVHPV